MIEGSHLRKILGKRQIQPAARLELTEDEEAVIVCLIRKGQSSGNYVTQRDVLDFVEEQFANV
jgi:hypothetical protein